MTQWQLPIWPRCQGERQKGGHSEALGGGMGGWGVQGGVRLFAPSDDKPTRSEITEHL